MNNLRDIRKESDGVMPETVDELEVKKHVRMKSKMGRIDVHCSDTVCGAWLTDGKNSIGVIADRTGVAICIYGSGSAIPVALTTRGLQIPKKDGGVEFFDWARLAEVLRK